MIIKIKIKTKQKKIRNFLSCTEQKSLVPDVSLSLVRCVGPY